MTELFLVAFSLGVVITMVPFTIMRERETNQHNDRMSKAYERYLTSIKNGDEPLPPPSRLSIDT